MYLSTFNCIKKENYLNKPRVNNVGLKQGDSLSPTLFNIFLNYIGKELNTENTHLKLGLHTLNHLLFADDLLLLSEARSGLQNCLEQLGKYCNKWNLNVNISKTKAMIFSKGKKYFTKFKFTKALLTPTLQPVRDLFATDFFATDWRSMRLVQPLYAHIRIEDYNRRQVCNWSAIDRRLVAVDTATCLQSGKTDRRQVGDQSATGRLNLLTQMAKRTGCCMSYWKADDIETNPRSVAD